MNQNFTFDFKAENSHDAWNRVVSTIEINGVHGFVEGGSFCPISEIPDTFIDPLDIELNSDSAISDEPRWELMDALQQALEEAPLNKIERERLYMAFYKSMSMNEIGVFCNRSKSSVHESLHRALDKLRDFFRDNEQYTGVLAKYNCA